MIQPEACAVCMSHVETYEAGAFEANRCKNAFIVRGICGHTRCTRTSKLAGGEK